MYYFLVNIILFIFISIDDLGPYTFSFIFSILGGRLLPLACQGGQTMK